MLLGALVGFAVGAVAGINGTDLASPVVAPLIGLLCGVAAGGIPFLFTGAAQHRREERLREARHDTFRVQAHDGWIEGIDLEADVPPRRPRRR